jgi:hypothetical protein
MYVDMDILRAKELLSLLPQLAIPPSLWSFTYHITPGAQWNQ